LAAPTARAMDRKFAFSSNKLSSFASISASRFGRPQNVVLPRSRSLKVNAAKELHFNKDGSAIRKLQVSFGLLVLFSICFLLQRVCMILSAFCLPDLFLYCRLV
jgi:hypothetical protein